MPNRNYHLSAGAQFDRWNGIETPAHYGDWEKEHAAVRQQAGLIDQTARSRLLLKGEDRMDFLHGMVTNDVLSLKDGSGCYAAITNSKAKMLSDCRIYALSEALLLDLEPGLNRSIYEHLDRYIIASAVTLEDLTESWGNIGLYGPKSPDILKRAFGVTDLPSEEYASRRIEAKSLDFICIRNHITGETGFDLLLPSERVPTLWEVLEPLGIRMVGWTALNALRVEAGIPRYGPDMDDTNFPMEARLNQRAISETKGCYIGQETIARVLAQGQMNRYLVGLSVSGEAPPIKDQVIMKNDRTVGKVTSGIRSPTLGQVIALGYVHRDFAEPGHELSIMMGDSTVRSTVVGLPFYQRP